MTDDVIRVLNEGDGETIEESLAALERAGLIERTGEVRRGLPVYRATDKGGRAVREDEGMCSDE